MTRNNNDSPVQVTKYQFLDRRLRAVHSFGLELRWLTRMTGQDEGKWYWCLNISSLLQTVWTSVTELPLTAPHWISWTGLKGTLTYPRTLPFKSGRVNLQCHMECPKWKLLGPSTAPLGLIMSITFACSYIGPPSATDPQSVNTLSDQTAYILNQCCGTDSRPAALSSAWLRDMLMHIFFGS